ncbi:DUF4124 domain-containing protein [Psychrobium sp. 1_MG-2023]|uniref:DUF4124 domain-containing protein n=1 Tax=Psychrobium sp. 1_MG-2023 TaxID=3062624 RepID=UPI000C348EBA|nr:DUF4124 domain-containing protein [Psychrobium sp. 1_MG-2023]MDP2561861.1 DUF4124 domain-containing protein [Psychrobium sp. 1_MG-2023]PKF55772.1 hypothetical protein CW748_11540 [Alteromonadales bacterium alter-6D02]
MRVILLISLFFTSYTFAKDIYQWVDKNGVTHFSHSKPENIAPDKIKNITKKYPSSFKSVSQLNKDKPLNAAQELERIAIENCAIATKNIEILRAFDNINQQDAEGNLSPLSADDKKKQLELAKKQAALFCKK